MESTSNVVTRATDGGVVAKTIGNMMSAFYTGMVSLVWGRNSHLWWAEDLVGHVVPKRNVYATGSPVVTWAGSGGAAEYSNRSVCNTFVVLLLQQAHGIDAHTMVAWLGTRWPRAPRLVTAIEAGDGFSWVRRVDQIRSGDVLSIRYPEGSSASGHVAIVRSAPVRVKARRPFVERTTQYEVAVVDSTRSPHGVDDTRVAFDGTRRGGAGFGRMRLYADDALNIVGHAWSPATGAPYRAEPEYHLAVGRLTRGG